nr:penicillin-binding protein 2 [Patulibacter sp. SYSU D01012]
MVQGDQRGSDVRTTLEPKVQNAAIAALGGRAGSVVAVEPSTGKVLAMVSVPGYDPTKAATDPDYLAGLKDAARLNRATQAAYVPGSTFKVVTAAAALDTGEMTPDSTVDGSDNQVFSATPLKNFGGENFPNTTLRNALTHSVNTAFAHVAEDLGKATMQEYMERFGFGQKPQLDLPSDELRTSGEWLARKNGKGRFIPATSKYVDVARLGIGQDKLQVTPLQMAMVAATVANGGRMMKPHLVDRVVDPDGRVQETVKPQEQRRVMSAGAAADLQSMMGDVVNEGTGTGSALAGIQVAGKTGTAELNIAQGLNDLWFIGSAPLQDPKVAVAVVVENTQGQGGTVAAPIAKQVFQAALSR